MEPLVVAATPKDLVAKTMDLRLELVQDSFSISHERLERNEGAKELNQVGELRLRFQLLLLLIFTQYSVHGAAVSG
jgi:hypothetical protein